MMSVMIRAGLAAGLLMLTVAASMALDAREGWQVLQTSKSFDQLVADTQAAIKSGKMGLVTQASASAGAAGQGIAIPGNRVIGVYRNDFARRMLEASIAAGIEAPIRLYLTDNADGTATLSYKTPSFVFAPYMDEGGDALRDLAAELDAIFAAIAEAAVK